MFESKMLRTGSDVGYRRKLMLEITAQLVVQICTLHQCGLCTGHM
jgi:hypothetical protein